jgi:hypothetical protein
VDTLDVWDVPTSSLWTTVVRLQFAL